MLTAPLCSLTDFMHVPMCAFYFTEIELSGVYVHVHVCTHTIHSHIKKKKEKRKEKEE